MTKRELYGLKDRLILPKESAKERARKHWDLLAKPLDGLGDLEQMIIQIAGIQGTEEVKLDKRAVIAMCADNGIVEEGVTQTGQEVTGIVAVNMAQGLSSVARMSRYAGADLMPVDIGIAGDVSAEGLICHRIRNGTRNFLLEPAMTEGEMLQAITCGMEMVKNCRQKGYHILLTGEMGIGNTTTSSAVASALLGAVPERLTGRGAGLTEERLSHKRQVVRRGLEKYDLLLSERKVDPFYVLQCVGGLDIAGLAGVFLGGARYHIPIVIDGVISACAALLAERMLPGCKEFMLASHKGKEPAAGLLLRELALKPVIDANLALGEGTGAVMLLPLLDMALAVYRENPSFGTISLTPYERFDKSEEIADGTGTDTPVLW